MEMKNKPKRRSVKTKIFGIIVISLFLITAVLGIFSFQFSKDRLISMLADRSKAIAATAANFINAEDIALIKNNVEGLREKRLAAINPMFSHLYEKTHNMPEDVSIENAAEKYMLYHDTLLEVKKANGIESPINIYAIDGKRLKLILSTDPSLLIGITYEMRPEIQKAAAENLPQASRIYRDKDGVWISAFAPITTRSSAMPEAVLGVDNKIDLYIDMLNRELIAIALICIVGLVIASAVGYRLIHGLARNIQKLDEMAGKIEKEDYSTRIAIQSQDEIGHLASTFEKLRLSIRNKIEELKSSLLKEKKAHLDSIKALTNAINIRDPYTRLHLYRVEQYAILIAKKMKLSKNEVEQLRYGCYLHDIGKIYVDDELFKKVDLSEAERNKIRQHAEDGAKIIEGIPFLQEVKEIILYHQERYDGKGYPEGLRGEKIPLLARLVAVADSFDAMTTDRPYKPKIPLKEAMDVLEKEAGKQFDPDIVKAFLKYRNEIDRIAKKHFKY